MRKIIVPIVLAVLVLAPGLAIGQEVKGPKIAVKEMRFDAGKVQQGKPVSHVFEMSNAGSAMLIIERVQPT